ncbi:MAG: signal recognition particle receptor subunit alpha, partial [Clostridiales bacterium]|nr:signal recognition particle receptor subunit alpha [Clostridiales bacterium]
MGFFDKLRAGLAKTKENFTAKIAGVFSRSRIDAELYDELEEALIQADVGVDTACFLVERLRQRVKKEQIKDVSRLEPVLREEIEAILLAGEGELTLEPGLLNIFVMVGVNGAGKTTTIGKLAALYAKKGKKVLLAAADTFRAAASE